MDLHARWPHRWRNTKTDSFNSPIHGLGVRANADIAKGEVVLVYGGIVVPKEDILEYWSICEHVDIQISDDFFLVPTTHEELEKDGVVNHSCEPNVGFRSQVELVAMRDIVAGEEITLDYACCESLFGAFACRCGTATCRMAITPDDWKETAIQDRLLPYFSPYLKSKI